MRSKNQPLSGQGSRESQEKNCCCYKSFHDRYNAKLRPKPSNKKPETPQNLHGSYMASSDPRGPLEISDLAGLECGSFDPYSDSQPWLEDWFLLYRLRAGIKTAWRLRAQERIEEIWYNRKQSCSGVESVRDWTDFSSI